jgi:hypothetical protein
LGKGFSLIAAHLLEPRPIFGRYRLRKYLQPLLQNSHHLMRSRLQLQ